MFTLSSRFKLEDSGEAAAPPNSIPEDEAPAHSLSTGLTSGNCWLTGLRAAGTHEIFSNCVLRDSEGSKMGLGL